jgi:hypothetical protein
MMPQERRLSVRKPLEHLVYLGLPFDNGGIVLDVSEGGLGFRAIAPVEVEADGPIHFRFATDSASRITAVGELAWKDESGRTCGLRFTDLPDEIREQIRIWTGQFNLSANSGTNSTARALPSGNPFLYNLKPAASGLPLHKSSAFPLQLDFKAGAIAAVVPQFVQLLDGAAEQVRTWIAESKASGPDAPFAGSALETEVEPRSETEFAPVVDTPMAEPAIEAEVADSNESDLAPIGNIPVAESAIEAEVTPSTEAESRHVADAINPILYEFSPPIHRRPSNTFSMFQLELDAETGTPSIAVPQTIAMKHPIAAVGVTIALAFLVSTGIFSYVCTTRAGDLLFDWGGKMWDGIYSQPVSQDPPPPASSARDASMPPQQ